MSTSADTPVYLHEETQEVSSATRIGAKIISILFHPMFIPVYVTALVLFVHPLLFAGYEDVRKWRLLATIVVNLTFLPLVTVFLSWRLGFLKGMYLDSQRERIIPLAAAMIFYFWCWFVLRDFTEIPEVFRNFLFGSFLTIIVAWLANIAYKVSLHTLACGGLVAFMFVLLLSTDGGSAWYIGASLLIAGLVSTARLLAGTHRPFDVYSGLVLGAICQLLALVV